MSSCINCVKVAWVCKINANICRRVYSSVQKYNLPSTIGNFETESNKINVLERVNHDVSEITPYYPKSFNLAAYVNTSETLKNLVNLNVNLGKIEKKPYVAEEILKLDFEKDIKKQIWFLKDYVGAEEIGEYITKNPLILCEPLEDLEIRVNYLRSKRFSDIQIQRIVSQNPFWLMFSTVRIDRRLGYYQEKFTLSGQEIRFLSAKQPRLITYNLHHINTNTFVIKEEMGFKDDEVKQLLLAKPRIWMLNQKNLLYRFNYLHNVVKIPHSTLLQNPGVFMCRNFKVKQRHTFLERLGRAQYDPTKENFVPIMALVEDTDIEFCKKYAKCNVVDFNTFLKTL